MNGNKEHMKGHSIDSWHILLDCYNVPYLSMEDIKAILIGATEVGEARLLEVKLHSFEGGGLTGVALLAESHITVHTWPENRYAAFDIFMCGDTDPHAAADWIKKSLSAERCEIIKCQRGMNLVKNNITKLNIK